jgi:hypothetical protein
MATIKLCREILGKEYDDLSDEEIIEIRDFLSMLADIAIESIERKELETQNINA